MAIEVRGLRREDIDYVIDIDRRVLGKERRSYWEDKFDEIFKKEGLFSLIAEDNGKVIGFILGVISGWEFRVPETTGWIDTIGVDPDYQGRGIGKLLFERLIEEMRKRGVKRVFTLVNWEDWDLLRFFRKMGFKRGEMINLSLDIS